MASVVSEDHAAIPASLPVLCDLFVAFCDELPFKAVWGILFSRNVGAATLVF